VGCRQHPTANSNINRSSPRPIHAALRAATAGADAALVGVTDRLVDAIDTPDAILQANLAPLLR
ncbi:MAG TPA: hypothetical protein VN325_22465, partial [Steroidobacteraceae bacterium]|nr:hypothetical protein [Steroidobacteraceae bacterium]